MKKLVVAALILVLMVMLVAGCTSNNRYPTGYASYGGYQGQGGQPAQQGGQYGGYVGGGCAVDGPADTGVQVAAHALAA